jgi:hypothetical protein
MVPEGTHHKGLHSRSKTFLTGSKYVDRRGETREMERNGGVAVKYVG